MIDRGLVNGSICKFVRVVSNDAIRSLVSFCVEKSFVVEHSWDQGVL